MLRGIIPFLNIFKGFFGSQAVFFFFFSEIGSFSSNLLHIGSISPEQMLKANPRILMVMAFDQPATFNTGHQGLGIEVVKLLPHWPESNV